MNTSEEVRIFPEVCKKGFFMCLSLNLTARISVGRTPVAASSYLMLLQGVLRFPFHRGCDYFWHPCVTDQRDSVRVPGAQNTKDSRSWTLKLVLHPWRLLPRGPHNSVSHTCCLISCMQAAVKELDCYLDPYFTINPRHIVMQIFYPAWSENPLILKMFLLLIE